MRVVVVGALGEVGSSLTVALRDAGHEVVRASARAPLPDLPVVVQVSALDLSGVDLVVNAGGRGDRRSQERTGIDSARLVAKACASADVMAVLLSTTRVLEGAGGDVDGDAPTQPISNYGRANAHLENLWLEQPGTHVLRLANVLCAPQTMTSPQVELLPWSLVTEALHSGTITVRSGPSTTREFVDAADMVSALEIMTRAIPPPRIVATLPGVRLSLAQLVEIVGLALIQAGHPAPTRSFGTDGPPATAVRPGWLAQQGWITHVGADVVTRMITDWLETET